MRKNDVELLETVVHQALIMMVRDLGYSMEHYPHNGHAAIRHQLMWSYIEEFYGNDFWQELRTVDAQHHESLKFEKNLDARTMVELRERITQLEGESKLEAKE